MRDILGSHPDVAMFPSELPLWRVLAAGVADRDSGRRDVHERLVEALVTHPRMRQAGIALDGRAILASLAEACANTVGAVFATILRQYARQVGRPRWGVKEPLSEFHADRIFAALPRARFVHMIRDPRDVVASQRGMWGARAQHVVSTTDAWLRSVALAGRQTTAWPGAYAAVRYEDLVADPAAVIRRVCDVLGLGYRPEMLQMTARPAWWVISSDDSLRDRHDIFTDAVARHLRQLPPADACYIERRARRQMNRWSYVRRPVPLTPRVLAPVLVRFAQEWGWRLIRRRRDADSFRPGSTVSNSPAP